MGSSNQRPPMAFHGNYAGSEVFAIDVDAMALVASIPTGDGPYPVDQVGPQVLYAITRREPSVTVIDLPTLKAVGRIPLPHRPRSASNWRSNTKGAALISGADKPQTSIVDVASGRVLITVGRDQAGTPGAFGGVLASGHERWMSDANRFFLLDRVNRVIEVYSAAGGERLQAIDTPTSVHHVSQHGDRSRFYAMCEGNPGNAIPPSVLVLDDNAGALKVAGELFLPVPLSEQGRMGGHHLDLHPDGRHLYVGSNEGKTYVCDSGTMSVVTVLETGIGAGHTAFVKGRGLAVTINHNARHVTVVDTANHRVLKHIQVASTETQGAKKSQGHTFGIDPAERYFYCMATVDATFVRIDLDRLDVSGTLLLRGEPLQGAFVWS